MGRATVAGLTALAVVGVVAGTMQTRDGASSPPTLTSAGLQAMISRAEARCNTTDEACPNCGSECTPCESANKVACCVTKAKDRGEKGACCKEDHEGIDPKKVCRDLHVCSEPSEDCSASHCCQDASLTCFRKDSHWAKCKETCEAGKIDESD